ncbi:MULTISPECIES: NAD(P)/FAD-dependent oxidoreductase [Rhodococcus]|uniref:NAD(P)/FAD-dependent oxidoreductase n=1 Tax=Rhodococcus oxybenzonivorans TaxID=1990687 RepID=A0AAE5A8I6_9NOCA|nr:MULTISPECIES: NAD(P)/FAD-dependent oxidoreductase [Rhodococcus]MDV7245129.1 NAD(P)/FAD-dependent oxidoreductase [Rhodococcus oxybenzonivorans]MDV7267561.1 NAD(P)/FAD-dependent oxidoreductase [Rhodococcus oxybenzonivorans]MDV7272589.1 NAD(P)/FAD-dependent oxidoreductase [Rhodococcus oxybenzonivorans]MDV7336154.1 NAD(P)/FAD-dependent oxidoreductase [Rhodococcus oxybenzonivorans]MDV7342840.1 NAD(P)/FAD-dependent oxidoreductase [Rhodococcus oxybenzonivorans]
MQTASPVTSATATESSQFNPDRLSESEVRTAVSIANVPALLMVVYQMTGDGKWLEQPYRPTRGKGLGDHDSGGLTEEIQEEIRQAAVHAILDFQAGVKPAIEAPTAEQTVRMISVCMGEPVADQYGPMLSLELARRAAPNAPELALPPVDPPVGFNVIVIGTGVAGIAAAHQLEDMGIDYIILEKQPEAGGNWWQNTYPGAGVDTPSHLYSFSFAKNDWNTHFELRNELQEYFGRVLKEVGGNERVRYNTEVLAATYDETSRGWHVEVRNADGSIETLRSNVVISAVGVLNRPVTPNLPGMESFRGTSFHSANWPEGLEVEGKRVAIVGTGASSMQITPAIADRVEHLTVFQRSPQWVAPFEKFRMPIPTELRRLLQSCSLYHSWYWIRLFWQFGDKVIESLRVDPEWEHPERSVNARNDAHREYFTRYITAQVGDRTDLLDKVMPDYPPFGKRILLDNGWYEALRRDNVDLVNESVAAVTETGLVSASGAEIDADIIVWATGFEAARFVSSLDVRGVDGLSLREAWNDDDPRAYLGVSVPQFPNFFMLGGPNSFPGSGSFMFFMEVQMRYIRGLLTKMFEHDIAAIDARTDATEEYNELVDTTHDRTVWTHRGMSTYYRNSRGRVVFVMPFLNVEYWEMTRRPDLENYTVR